MQLRRAQLSERQWEWKWEESQFLPAVGEIFITGREKQVVEVVRRLL